MWLMDKRRAVPLLNRKAVRRFGKRRRAPRKRTLGGRGELAANYTPFPPTQFCKMPFAATSGLSSAATQSVTGTEIVYRLNSIFEPKVVAPLFRASGYDEIRLIYKRYKVHGCMVDVTFSDPSADGLYWVVAMRAPGSITNTNTLRYTSVDMRYLHWTGALNNTGSQVAHFRRYINISKISGLTNLQFKADTTNFTSEIISNPNAVPVVVVNVANSKDATVQGCNFTIKLTYHVQLYDKVELTSSPVI